MFAPLPWQQYARKYKKFEKIEGFISETSSVITIIQFLYRFCLLE